jgi:hypothetical protein
MDIGGLSSRLFVLMLTIVLISVGYSLYQLFFPEGKPPYIVKRLVNNLELMGCDKYYGNLQLNLNQALKNPAKVCVFEADTQWVTDLPPEIWQLTKLKQLSLSGGIRSDISQGKLMGISGDIDSLSDLKLLNLHNNSLKEIPHNIGALINLEELDLSSNYLESLPEEVWTLNKLKVLNLNYNDFTELPEEISQLNELEELDLLGNQISLEDFNHYRQLLPNTKIIFDGK